MIVWNLTTNENIKLGRSKLDKELLNFDMGIVANMKDLIKPIDWRIVYDRNGLEKAGLSVNWVDVGSSFKTKLENQRWWEEKFGQVLAVKEKVLEKIPFIETVIKWSL